MAKEKVIKKLYESSMEAAKEGGVKAGLDAYRTNFEQSLGIVVDEDTGVKTYDANQRELDHNNLDIGRLGTALLGRDWAKVYEGNWVKASQNAQVFEGQGGAVLAGTLASVSALTDSIAGLANARALEKQMDPEFIYNEMCTETEVTGEGGYDIRVRTAGENPRTDLADGEAFPSVSLKPTRIHRNRSHRQGIRTKLSLQTVMDDLTGTLYEAVDENSLLVLNERERKVADCLMSIGTAVAPAGKIGQPGLVVPVQQDGSSFAPYQTSLNTSPSPENQLLVQNYVNAVNGSAPPTNYTCIEQAIGTLVGNVDPFNGLPVQLNFKELQMFVVPATMIQAHNLLEATEIWNIGSVGLTTAYAKNMVTPNPLKPFQISLHTSQIWAKRLVDVGIIGQVFTNTATNNYTTANDIRGFWMLGHFKKAVKYAVRQPYQVQQVPLSSIEYGSQIVLVQDVFEQGQCYFINPRVCYRAYS